MQEDWYLLLSDQNRIRDSTTYLVLSSRNQPAGCQGADSLFATRVLQSHMALWKLLRQNTRQHWQTAKTNTYVSVLCMSSFSQFYFPSWEGSIILLSLSLSLSLPQPPCPQWTPVPHSSLRTVPCVFSQAAIVPSLWRVLPPTPTVAGHTQSREDSWALSVSHI